MAPLEAARNNNTERCFVAKTRKTIFIDLIFLLNHFRLNTFLDNIKYNIIKPIEYKIHPTASMIKESFVNINDGDILGFNKLHFLKCYMKTVHNLLQVQNKTEGYWNYLFNKLYLYDLE